MHLVEKCYHLHLDYEKSTMIIIAIIITKTIFIDGEVRSQGHFKNQHWNEIQISNS